MRIVIIGGLGMIGRAFSELAARKGHELILLSRRQEPRRMGGNIEIRQWDGKNVAVLSELIDNADALINLAGESIGKGWWTKKRKEALLSSRLEPANALVNALPFCKNPPKTIMQASAIGFYGTGKVEKTEISPAGDDYLANFATLWEETTTPVEKMKIRRIIIRTGIVLQRNEGVLQQLTLPFKLMFGGPIGPGDQIVSWIHIKDEIAAMLFLLETPSCNGIYNLSSPNPCTNTEIGKGLAKVMKRPYWFPVPAFLLRLVMGEMSTLVLDGQKVLPERLLNAGYQFQYQLIGEALDDLLIMT